MLAYLKRSPESSLRRDSRLENRRGPRQGRSFSTPISQRVLFLQCFCFLWDPGNILRPCLERVTPGLAHGQSFGEEAPMSSRENGRHRLCSWYPVYPWAICKWASAEESPLVASNRNTPGQKGTPLEAAAPRIEDEAEQTALGRGGGHGGCGKDSVPFLQPHSDDSPLPSSPLAPTWIGVNGAAVSGAYLRGHIDRSPKPSQEKSWCSPRWIANGGEGKSAQHMSPNSVFIPGFRDSVDRHRSCLCDQSSEPAEPVVKCP